LFEALDMRPAHLSLILAREFGSVADGQHTPVMIWGPPGVGKSELVGQVAAGHGVPLIDVRLSQMEPTDLRGIPYREGNHVFWSVPALLPDARRHGPAGILFLDEITSAPPTVSAAAYQLILDRRLGDYQLPPGWAIFAAGNRQGDRGVTYAMPSPLANRFTHYDLDVHLDDWVLWANRSGIDTRLVAFLRFRPDLLFHLDLTHHPMAFPSPRSWAFAHRALGKFADDQALLRDALIACVGPVAGMECLAFLDNMARLPDLDAILAGSELRVPEEIDLQYGVAAALVRRAAQRKDARDAMQVFGRILAYAQRFPQREMGLMLVSDLHRTVGRPLFAVPEFADWANSISDLLLADLQAP
jgi:hypothetical protein